MAVIEIDHLTKRYGAITAVDDLTFDVAGGTVTGFIGPNGSGKTTTMRLLLGWSRPDAGRATFDGVRYRDLKRPLQQVGALLEPLGFHPGRSGRSHLLWLARAMGLSRGRVDEVLETLEIADAAGRRVKGYSLGMRQRLGLAQALLADPPVLVLDEPANGLDPAGIRWLRRLLRRLADQGRTVLVSSHLLAELAQSIDAAVIIAKGRLVAAGTMAELTAGSERRTRVKTSRREELAQLLQSAGLAVDGSGEALLVDAAPERVAEIAMRAGIPIRELASVHSNLEDVVLELTDDEQSTPSLV